MVSINEAIIARIKKKGETFEILVDCDKALEYKTGLIDSLEDVLATPDIYKDVKQGEHASEQKIKEAFHLDDKKKVASIIIKEGEIQLTTEHKGNLRKEKRKQIVYAIHREAIDPKTGHPHPIETINMVMDEAKVKVDEFQTVEKQVKEIIPKLRPFIALKIETRELEIIIPAQYTGNAFNVLKKIGSLLKDEWQNDGSLKVVLEIPAGMQEELEKELNKLTKGDVEFKILKKT
jgi:ribosome maturation protein SDO1